MKRFLRYLFLLLFFFETKEANAQINYQEIGLTDKETIYLNENQEIKVLIDNYLKDKGKLTEDDQSFVKSLVSLTITHNFKLPIYTEEDYPGKKDGLPYEWWKEPEKYISFED